MPPASPERSCPGTAVFGVALVESDDTSSFVAHPLKAKTTTETNTPSKPDLFIAPHPNHKPPPLNSPRAPPRLQILILPVLRNPARARNRARNRLLHQIPHSAFLNP